MSKRDEMKDLMLGSVGKGKMFVHEHYKKDGEHTMFVNDDKVPEYSMMGYSMADAEEIYKEFGKPEDFDSVEGNRIYRIVGTDGDRRLKAYLMRCPNRIRDARIAADDERARRKLKELEQDQDERTSSGHKYVHFSNDKIIK